MNFWYSLTEKQSPGRPFHHRRVVADPVRDRTSSSLLPCRSARRMPGSSKPAVVAQDRTVRSTFRVRRDSSSRKCRCGFRKPRGKDYQRLRPLPPGQAKGERRTEPRPLRPEARGLRPCDYNQVIVLTVYEIYLSVQGESTHVGRPCVSSGSPPAIFDAAGAIHPMPSRAV